MMVYYHMAHICKKICLNSHIKCWMKCRRKILDLLEIHLISVTKLKAVNPDELNPEKQSKLKRFLNVQKLQLMKYFLGCNQ